MGHYVKFWIFAKICRLLSCPKTKNEKKSDSKVKLIKIFLQKNLTGLSCLKRALESASKKWKNPKMITCEPPNHFSQSHIYKIPDDWSSYCPPLSIHRLGLLCLGFKVVQCFYFVFNFFPKDGKFGRFLKKCKSSHLLAKNLKAK